MPTLPQKVPEKTPTIEELRMALSQSPLDVCKGGKQNAIFTNKHLLETATILASMKHPSMTPTPDLVSEVRDKLVMAISGGALDEDLRALIEATLSPSRVAITSTVIANLATRATDLVITSTTQPTDSAKLTTKKRKKPDDDFVSEEASQLLKCLPAPHN